MSWVDIDFILGDVEGWWLCGVSNGKANAAAKAGPPLREG